MFHSISYFVIILYFILKSEAALLDDFIATSSVLNFAREAVNNPSHPTEKTLGLALNATKEIHLIFKESMLTSQGEVTTAVQRQLNFSENIFHQITKESNASRAFHEEYPDIPESSLAENIYKNTGTLHTLEESANNLEWFGKHWTTYMIIMIVIALVLLSLTQCCSFIYFYRHIRKIRSHVGLSSRNV